MEELIFNQGRATVDLPDGRVLSILNTDRNEVIVEAEKWSPAYILHGEHYEPVMARPGTFEVAVLAGPAGPCVHEVIPEWDAYHLVDRGWTVYRSVPLVAIEAYVDRQRATEQNGADQ